MSEIFMKRRSDLHRKYADMIDMCEGTKVKARQCVRFDGSIIYSAPMFNGYIDSYRFALAIVEDKPVFTGDVLYWKSGSTGHKIKEISEDGWFHSYEMSVFHVTGATWTKPNQFADILQAQAEGKRVVFYDGAKWVDTDVIDTVNFNPVSYRVADKDETKNFDTNVFGETVFVKYTKCGITGKISAEVLK
jgi:hypothetical protein